MSVDVKVDVKRSDFDSYEDYAVAFEEARQKEVARRRKLDPEQLEEEEDKLEGEHRNRFSNYINDYARSQAVSEGVSPTGETMKNTPEEAMSGETQTALGKKATEDKKKNDQNKATNKATDTKG